MGQKLKLSSNFSKRYFVVADFGVFNNFLNMAGFQIVENRAFFQSPFLYILKNYKKSLFKRFTFSPSTLIK